MLLKVHRRLAKSQSKLNVRTLNYYTSNEHSKPLLHNKPIKIHGSEFNESLAKKSALKEYKKENYFGEHDNKLDFKLHKSTKNLWSQELSKIIRKNLFSKIIESNRINISKPIYRIDLTTINTKFISIPKIKEIENVCVKTERPASEIFSNVIILNKLKKANRSKSVMKKKITVMGEMNTISNALKSIDSTQKINRIKNIKYARFN